MKAGDTPIRIKLYGLFSVTRRGYIAQLAIGGLLLIGLLIVRAMMPSLSQLGGQTEDMAVRGRVMLWLLDNLHWVVLAFVILFGVEAFFVLRRFARLEAERLGKQP